MSLSTSEGRVLSTNTRLVLELVVHHGEMNNKELENLNKVSGELDDAIEFEMKFGGPVALPKRIEDRIVELSTIDEPNSDDSEDEFPMEPMCKSSEVILRRILSKVSDLLDDRVGIFGRGDGGWGVDWRSSGKTEVAFNIKPENFLDTSVHPQGDHELPRRTERFSTFAPCIEYFDDEDDFVKFIREKVAKRSDLVLK